jgi:transposase
MEVLAFTNECVKQRKVAVQFGVAESTVGNTNWVRKVRGAGTNSISSFVKQT